MSNRVHEQMIADNNWVKQHSYYEKDPVKRGFGSLYLTPTDINFKEQVEMSFRALGKAYDWELEKFRLSQKSVDKTNRRRFLKNTVRFIKNPYGYTFWKLLIHMDTPKLFGVAVFFSIIGSMIGGLKESYFLNQKMQWYNYNGENVNGNGTQQIGFKNTKLNFPLSLFFSTLFTPPGAELFVTNPANDQNIRLHLELLKKYDKL